MEVRKRLLRHKEDIGVKVENQENVGVKVESQVDGSKIKEDKAEKSTERRKVERKK